MGCPTEIEIGDNLIFSICTHDPDTGVLTDADAVPSYRIYEDETATPILTGDMAKLDDANTTGFYTETIACTSGNGFKNGKTYTIYIVATVDADTGGICYGVKAYDRRKADVIAVSTSTDAADKLEASAETIVIGTAATGTLSTTEMTTDLTISVNDQMNGRILIFKEDTTTAALRRQATNITDTAITNGKLTFTAITTAPVNGDTFVIL